jgi:hypothetical protein
MPANRMNAPTGSEKLNVIGSSSATVSAGPMPGSTPTSVPSVTPAAASSRFWGDRTSPKPSMRLAASTSTAHTPHGPLGSCTLSQCENAYPATTPRPSPTTASRTGLSEPGSHAVSHTNAVVASA